MILKKFVIIFTVICIFVVFIAFSLIIKGTVTNSSSKHGNEVVIEDIEANANQEGRTTGKAIEYGNDRNDIRKVEIGE